MFASFKKSCSLCEAVLDRAGSITVYTLVFAVPLLVLMVSPPLGLIIGGVVLWRRSKLSPAAGTSHGTSRWATISDLMKAKCVFRKEGLSLGRVCNLQPAGFMLNLWALLTWPLASSREANLVSRLAGNKPEPIELSLPDKTPHASIYGASGSGKSTSYAIPHTLNTPGSLVILDSKGEIAKLTARERALRFGSEIVVIDPFGVAEGCGFNAAQFNPLDLFQDQPERLVDEARRLAGALVVTTGDEKDPFWSKASTTLITAVAVFLVSEAKTEKATLNHLREIMTNPKMMDDMLEHMSQSDACGGLLRRLAGQISQLQGQTKASVYSVANSHIDFLDSLVLRETLSTSSFDPRKLVDGNMTIYICLPVDRVNELSGLQRVILSSLINVVFAAGEDRNRRVHFFLDEAATLGPMDALYNAVQFGRSFGHRLSFYFQSVTQVERCFPESQAQDFRATTAEVFCGVANHATAKEVSDWIGSTTVSGATVQDGWNWGSSNSIDTIGMNGSHGNNSGGSQSTSYSETGRPLIMPEEVLQLPQDQAIVLIPGVRPIMAEKVPYFARQHPRVLKRLMAATSNLFFLAATWSVMGLSFWALTIGRQHPMVVRVHEGFMMLLHG